MSGKNNILKILLEKNTGSIKSSPELLYDEEALRVQLALVEVVKGKLKQALKTIKILDPKQSSSFTCVNRVLLELINAKDPKACQKHFQDLKTLAHGFLDLPPSQDASLCVSLSYFHQKKYPEAIAYAKKTNHPLGQQIHIYALLANQETRSEGLELFKSVVAKQKAAWIKVDYHAVKQRPKTTNVVRMNDGKKQRVATKSTPPRLKPTKC